MTPLKRCVIITLVLITILIIISVFLIKAKSKGDDNLQLVHVVFRHGDRTPEYYKAYPNDPYKDEVYFPYGQGQLITKGKRRQYLLGKSLRERYETFLPNNWEPNLLEAFTTNANRTVISLQLVLSGLFPSRKDESCEDAINLSSERFPYTVLDTNVMSMPLVHCKGYLKRYIEFMKSSRGAAINIKHKKLFQYLSQYVGRNITTIVDVYAVYANLRCQNELGLQLPTWAHDIFPRTLEDAQLAYYVSSQSTTELKQLSGGFLLKQIIEYTNLKLKIDSLFVNKKMFMYSGHDYNIVALLDALEIFEPHVPRYGACVIIEVHSINNVDGFKVFYNGFSTASFKEYKVPGCDFFCPFEKFESLLHKNLPPNINFCNN